jgi:hypothetical protein
LDKGWLARLHAYNVLLAELFQHICIINAETVLQLAG